MMSNGQPEAAIHEAVTAAWHEAHKRREQAVQDALDWAHQTAAADAQRAADRHATALKDAVVIAKQEAVRSCEGVVRQAVEATVGLKAAESALAEAQEATAAAQQEVDSIRKQMEEMHHETSKTLAEHHQVSHVIW